MQDITRRRFVCWATSAGAATGILRAQGRKRFLIRMPQAGPLARLAARELLRGVSRLIPAQDVMLSDGAARPAGADKQAVFQLETSGFRHRDAYVVQSKGNELMFRAGNERALLYATYDFLERQGVFFGIDGDLYPLQMPGALVLPAEDAPWEAAPRFATRGLLPWPDFLNCITVYNEEDFRAYFESMLRMRCNMFGMHVYTGAAQWAESYLSFEYAGVGHLAFLDTSATHRWGYLPQRTSRYVMGAADYFAGETFASDATMGRDAWEIAERTRELLRKAFAYARRLGIQTGIGFEPYQIPDEIWRALPPEVRPARMPERSAAGARFDAESVTARDLLETRLGQLLEAYPDVDYVWLWEDEQMNWESRRTGVPLSVTPFQQAHDFLRRHAPAKRMVLAGWGGVARHFADFHRRLPGDVIFSCLSDSLGWDPVHEVFGQLEGRERWPIPWLEDDPAMWLPQFHVHRFERDINLAEKYGCQGMLGIHWRHRIVDPTAGFFARALWDRQLSPAAYYAAFARTQAAGERTRQLAEILTDTDRNNKLLSTFTGEWKDGHAVTREYAGDYNEAFTFWNDYEPPEAVMASQREVAAALRELTSQSASARERGRLDYLARHVEFLVPYAEAFRTAHRLHRLLGEAAALKKDGKAQEAAELVRNRGVALWRELAPLVRQAMLLFQGAVATRNDLGTLASLQNKFVRLALIRLRLSLREYLQELPPATEALLKEVIAVDPAAPARLFLPTRPSMLGPGESVRLFLVAPGGSMPRRVALHWRERGSATWLSVGARLVGRRTWEAQLGPAPPRAAILDYFAAADERRDPVEAPRDFYTVTVM